MNQSREENTFVLCQANKVAGRMSDVGVQGGCRVVRVREDSGFTSLFKLSANRRTRILVEKQWVRCSPVMDDIIRRAVKIYDGEMVAKP